jgi:YHS domain-containing protein
LDLIPLTIISSKKNIVSEGLKEIMFRDPVCGMMLDETTAKFKITYEGETYHFCSLQCKKRFKRHQSKFIK